MQKKVLAKISEMNGGTSTDIHRRVVYWTGKKEATMSVLSELRELEAIKSITIKRNGKTSYGFEISSKGLGML